MPAADVEEAKSGENANEFNEASTVVDDSRLYHGGHWYCSRRRDRDQRGNAGEGRRRESMQGAKSLRGEKGLQSVQPVRREEGLQSLQPLRDEKGQMRRL